MSDEFKPKKGCSYEPANDVKAITEHMISIGMFPTLDIEKMAFVRSKKKPKKAKKEKTYTDDEAGKLEKELDAMKGKRKFIARCHTTSKFWSEIYGDKTVHFCVEVASENFDVLSESDKIRVIIHELYHIPHKFEVGKLVQHDEFGCIHMLYDKYKELNKDKDVYKLG